MLAMVVTVWAEARVEVGRRRAERERRRNENVVVWVSMAGELRLRRNVSTAAAGCCVLSCEAAGTADAADVADVAFWALLHPVLLLHRAVILQEALHRSVIVSRSSQRNKWFTLGLPRVC